jgi:hypothetical protein
MDLVDVNSIKNVELKGNVIYFNDGKNDYSFNNTKTTLYKRFVTPKPILDFDVDILKDPFDSLEVFFKENLASLVYEPIRDQEHIFLPLYSTKNGEKFVSEKSGLNQWNASGRKRNYSEVYIPIPSWVHKTHPSFFPPRDSAFDLILPNGSKLNASLCQDGSKALMSNPNAELGKWLLRDVLNLREGEILTYRKLNRIGLDSVVIYKLDEGKYSINFTKIGSFENFVNKKEVSGVAEDSAQD